MTDTSETESEVVKKPAKEKEITVVQDQGRFLHSTGDTYDGFFEAKKKDKSVKMHGPGVYTTAEGDIYSGTWESDKLNAFEVTTIQYKDGSKYEGFIRDWSYQSAGKYSYPDGSYLTCDFMANAPTGSLTMTDPNGHQWLAKADVGFAWFEPVNHYYDMLERSRDVPKNKKKRKTLISDSSAAISKKKVSLKLKSTVEMKKSKIQSKVLK
ncbi:uncharacterized protein LOC126373589 [Pectinophora gossypiella]|uniref:uncharacterized protein LOC126373589 n=1 Tax=Pectinophora gossypiella TaxID=13191 RepID=UPI00214E8D7E|nr:uncharacterized protein LOC126373589 [Pectinophora gossypiella]